MLVSVELKEANSTASSWKSTADDLSKKLMATRLISDEIKPADVENLKEVRTLDDVDSKCQEHDFTGAAITNHRKRIVSVTGERSVQRSMHSRAIAAGK